MPNLSVAAAAVPPPTGTGIQQWVICPTKCICCLIAARGAGSTKQCQGSAGSQSSNPATRSRRMSIQSQLASPRRSCQIQLTTFPAQNNCPGAVATRERSPSSSQHHRSGLEGKFGGAEPVWLCPLPCAQLCSHAVHVQHQHPKTKPAPVPRQQNARQGCE